jgi:hypothetical protein
MRGAAKMPGGEPAGVLCADFRHCGAGWGRAGQRDRDGGAPAIDRHHRSRSRGTWQMMGRCRRRTRQGGKRRPPQRAGANTGRSCGSAMVGARSALGNERARDHERAPTTCSIVDRAERPQQGRRDDGVELHHGRRGYLPPGSLASDTARGRVETPAERDARPNAVTAEVLGTHEARARKHTSPTGMLVTMPWAGVTDHPATRRGERESRPTAQPDGAQSHGFLRRSL